MSARLRQVFEFLTSNVLQAIFVKQSQEKIELDTTSSAGSSSNLISRQATKDGDASSTLLESLNKVLFSNVTRYLEMYREPKEEDEETAFFYTGNNCERADDAEEDVLP